MNCDGYMQVCAFQIEGIRRQYKELEDRLIELRNQSKAELNQLLEDEVGKKLSKLSRQLLKINSRVYSHHQVCIAISHSITKLLVFVLNANQPTYECFSIRAVNIGMPLHIDLNDVLYFMVIFNSSMGSQPYV